MVDKLGFVNDLDLDFVQFDEHYYSGGHEYLGCFFFWFVCVCVEKWVSCSPVLSL